ncbi:helix-turn-helix domain-containing protein [Devosia beringensis]|uniref:winged helix-turn-helix transcriptional regulator n=1 Tax=Devosia beringensis TaxID=2657486 RepID=UPI00186B7999|nr:winged helix-turn-helix transcriptional regulator [Devosia beringensis]
MFIAEQREINAALIATFLGVALGSRDTGAGRHLSMRELAAQIALPPSTVSRHVRYLGPGIREGEEGMGLVELVPSLDDGRAKHVRLTLKGEALLGRVLMASG